MSQSRPTDAGSVLVLTLMATLVVVGLGLTAIWMGSSGTKVAGNLTRRQEALFAAESGVERARSILVTSGNLVAMLNGTGCSATDDDPTGRGNVMCDNTVPLERIPVVEGSTATAGQVTQAAQNSTFTIFVRNDDAEYAWCNGVVDPNETADDGDCDGDGTPETDVWRATNDQDGRVVVRVEGLGADGISYAALEVVAAQMPGTVDIPDYSQEGGSPQGGNGQDVETPGVGAAGSP